MTVDEVRQGVAQVEAAYEGPQSLSEPHRLADDLYMRVLTAIAEGTEDPQAIAIEAIKAERWVVQRWFS